MFGKSHEQKASEHAATALAEARAAAKERLGSGQAAHMRDAVVEKAGVAGEKWQHGVDAVTPKVQAAVEAAAPKVEHARETFVEDVLPKVAETIAAVTATALAAKESAKAGAESARESAAVRLQDYVDQAPDEWVNAIPGVEKRPKKSGKWLIMLGLAAAGAAAYAVFSSRKAPEDPWSTPRYDSSGAQKTYGSAATTESKVEAVKEKAAAAGAAVAAKAGEVKDKVQEKVEEKTTDPKGHAQDAVDSATDAAGDVADTVRGKDAGDKLADAGEKVTEGDFGTAADTAGDAASDAWDDVRGKDAGDKLADAGDSAGEAAGDAWTDAKSWADDKVDDAKK